MDRYALEKKCKTDVKDVFGYIFHFDRQRSDIRWGLWQKDAVNFHSSTCTHGDPQQPSGRVAEMNACSIFISRYQQPQTGVSPFCWTLVWIYTGMRSKLRGEKADPQRNLPAHEILLQLGTIRMKTKRLWQKNTGFRGLSVPQPEFIFPIFAMKIWI